MYLGFSSEKTLNVYQQLIRKCMEILSETVLKTPVENEKTQA
jgi:hypothetical protein